MTERFAIALVAVCALALAISLARKLLTAYDRRVLTRLQAVPTNAATANADVPSAPRILYFTTETCVVCKRQQAPALAALRDRLPALRIEEHDAVRESALAGEFHIRSVPTTAVFSADGALVAINRGFAPASMLLAQIEGRTPDLEGGIEMAAESVGETRLS